MLRYLHVISFTSLWLVEKKNILKLNIYSTECCLCFRVADVGNTRKAIKSCVSYPVVATAYYIQWPKSIYVTYTMMMSSAVMFSWR